jgi:hypothetical protein
MHSDMNQPKGWTTEELDFDFRQGKETSSWRPDRLWDPPIVQSLGTGSSVPEGKAAGAWGRHSPSSAEGKNAWSYTSTPPYIFMA